MAEVIKLIGNLFRRYVSLGKKYGDKDRVNGGFGKSG